MLKKSALRRIMVTSLALFIFGILSLFPNHIQKSYQQNIVFDNMVKTSVYLVGPTNHVARTKVIVKNEEPLNQAREIVDLLTINSSKSHYIPNGFHAVLPSGTKLLNVTTQDNILKLDFNKEFLNMPKDSEEFIMESLIYSLTEIKGINGILIYVNGELLESTPQKHVKLPNVLTREYGVNKIYDLTSFHNVSKTTIYYVGKHENTTYYIPVTEITNSEKEKVEIIIERLKSSPIHQTNLMSYLSANAELLDYEILENNIQLSFNHYLFDDFQNKHILEEVQYSIALSLKDTLDIDTVSFMIDGENYQSNLDNL